MEERASILRFLIYLNYNIGSAAGLVNYLTSNIYSVSHKVLSYKFNLHRMPYKNISKVLISYRTYLISFRGNGSLTLYECTKIDAHYPSASNIRLTRTHKKEENLRFGFANIKTSKQKEIILNRF